MIYNKNQRKNAIIFIDKCFEKNRVIKIDYIPESKSLNQNRYLWLIFTIIADDSGNNPQDIYEYYLNKFPVFKEINLNGDYHSIMVSLSQFTKEQCSNFIDKIVIDATQEGYVIPDPEDLKTLEAYNYYRKKGLID